MWFVCEWQVKLCDPLVTHGSYLSAVAIGIIKRHINSPCFFTLLYTKFPSVVKLSSMNNPQTVISSPAHAVKSPLAVLFTCVNVIHGLWRTQADKHGHPLRDGTRCELHCVWRIL